MTVLAPAPTPVRTEPTTADVLERAADIIEEVGWIQGEYGDASKGLCILGAIGMAWRSFGGSFRAVPDSHALLGLPNAAVWNDARGRTKQQVVRRLREAAAAALALPVLALALFFAAPAAASDEPPPCSPAWGTCLEAHEGDAAWGQEPTP
jgi:hypothetical protein